VVARRGRQSLVAGRCTRISLHDQQNPQAASALQQPLAGHICREAALLWWHGGCFDKLGVIEKTTVAGVEVLMPVPESPLARVGSRYQEASILLLDGFPDSRHMYAECLRAARLQPVECDDTADALAHAQRVDLIVTGIRVPGPFDGLELVRRLRADDRTLRKPIIVLSACAMMRDQESARSAGCSVFLPKPCLPDVLIREIRRLLASRRREAHRCITSPRAPQPACDDRRGIRCRVIAAPRRAHPSRSCRPWTKR
jgi:CheY-like chemotaxis protein